MVNLKILRRAIAVGVMFELLLVVAAHYRPWLKPNFLMFGCMLIQRGRTLYARDLARDSGRAPLAAPQSGLAEVSWRWRRPICSATGPICR